MKTTLPLRARRWILVLLTSVGVLAPRLACADDLVTGAIPLNPTAASVVAQDELIQLIPALGVIFGGSVVRRAFCHSFLNLMLFDH